MSNTVLVWDENGKLARTRNFLDVSPVWEDISSIVTGNVNDGVIDWHSPFVTSGGAAGDLGAYLVTTEGTNLRIYYISDIQAETLQILMPLHTYQMASNNTVSSARIDCSRDVSGFVCVLWHDKDIPNNLTEAKYGESVDGGMNWSSIQSALLPANENAANTKDFALGLALDNDTSIATTTSGHGYQVRANYPDTPWSLVEGYLGPGSTNTVPQPLVKVDSNESAFFSSINKKYATNPEYLVNFDADGYSNYSTAVAVDLQGNPGYCARYSALLIDNTLPHLSVIITEPTPMAWASYGIKYFSIDYYIEAPSRRYYLMIARRSNTGTLLESVASLSIEVDGSGSTGWQTFSGMVHVPQDLHEHSSNGDITIFLSTIGTVWDDYYDAVDFRVDNISFTLVPVEEKLIRVDNYIYDGNPPPLSTSDITPEGGFVPDGPYGLSIDSSIDTRVALVGRNGDGLRKLFLSIDNGDNWVAKGTVSHTGVHLHGNYLLAFGPSGVYWSLNGGTNFASKNGNLDSVRGVGSHVSGMMETFSLLSNLSAPVHVGLTCSDGNAHAFNNQFTSRPIGLRVPDKVESVTDLSLNTPAGALSFKRTYYQNRQTNELYQFMGAGWTHNHHIHVREDTSQDPRTLIAYMADGSEVHFTATSGGGNPTEFAGEAGSNSSINVDRGTTPVKYTLTTASKSRYTFEYYQTSGNFTEARLVNREWSNGDVWTYCYDVNDRLVTIYDQSCNCTGVSNPCNSLTPRLSLFYNASSLLERVEDNAGRIVQFTYVTRDSGTKHLLADVTDVRGYVWTYEYATTATAGIYWLTKYKSPTVDGERITLKDISYVHDGTKFTSITEKLGIIESNDALRQTNIKYLSEAVTEEQHVDGMPELVTKHRFAGVYLGSDDPLGNSGTQLQSAQYRPTIQFDPNGNTTNMDWSSDGKNLQRVTDSLNNRTNFAYDSEDRLVESIDAEGRKTLYFYDDPNAPRQPTKIIVQGPELVENADMEEDAVWRKFPSSTYPDFQSSDQSYSGTYSWFAYLESVSFPWLESNEFPDGMKANQPYLLRSHVYQTSGRIRMYVGGHGFSGHSGAVDAADGSGWQTLETIFIPDNDATQTKLQFINISLDEPGIFYVDDVSVVPLLRWQEFTYQNGKVTQEKLLNPADPTGTPIQQTDRVYGTTGNDAGLLQSVTLVDPVDSMNNTTTTYTYDSAGRVIQTDISGLLRSCHKSRTVYDEAGNVVASICNYDPDYPDPQVYGSLVPTTAAEAEDLRERIYTEIAANPSFVPNFDKNRVTTHAYDNLGRRVATKAHAGDPESQMTYTIYDALGRVRLSISDYDGTGYNSPVRWVWEGGVWKDAPSGTQIDQSAGKNLITETVYNEMGLVRLRRDVLGNLTLYGYDDAGRLVKTVQNASKADYNNAFTGAGADPDLSDYEVGGISQASDADLITAQFYDAVGNLVQSIDQRGITSFTVYDALNRPIKTVRNAKDAATIDLEATDTGYDAANDPRSASYVLSNDPDRDFINTTAYDSLGRTIRTRQLLDAPSGGSEVWDTTLYGYDNLGRQVRVIRHALTPDYDIASDPDLSSYTISANADGDMVSITVYDTDGRVLYTEDLNGNRNWTGYDGLGRSVKSIVNAKHTAVGDGSANDPRSNQYVPSTEPDEDIITLTEYNADGLVASTTDVLGRVTYHVYDTYTRRVRSIRNYVQQIVNQGEVAEIVLPQNWYWDNVANEWKGTISTGNTDIDRGTDDDINIITDYVYDSQGRMQQTIDVRRNVNYTVYDDRGRQVMTIANYVPQNGTDPTDWEWANQQWEDGGGIAISHDSNAPTAVNDQNLIRATEYDYVGRVLQTRDTEGNLNRMVYDALGRQVMTIANYVAQGGTAPENWLWKDNMRRWEDGGDNPINHGTKFDQNLISQTRYNQAGEVFATRDARGTVTSFTYDDVGRRLSTTQADGTAMATTSYTCFDKAGRVLRQIANYSGEGDPDARNDSTWTFAPQDHGPANDQNLIDTYTYDGASRRVTATDPVGNVTETVYFKDGQVKGMVQKQVEVAGTATDVETQYRYDELRRRTLVVQGYLAQATDPEDWVWNTTQWEDN